MFKYFFPPWFNVQTKLNIKSQSEFSLKERKVKIENLDEQTNKIIQKSFTLYNCSKDQTHINVISSITRWKVKIKYIKVSTRLL